MQVSITLNIPIDSTNEDGDSASQTHHTMKIFDQILSGDIRVPGFSETGNPEPTSESWIMLGYLEDAKKFTRASKKALCDEIEEAMLFLNRDGSGSRLRYKPLIKFLEKS
jgi:hypothetical protein